MTKREARIQLLADLELPDQGVLWDLGAGTGSIGLEALRLRPQLSCWRWNVGPVGPPSSKPMPSGST